MAANITGHHRPDVKIPHPRTSHAADTLGSRLTMYPNRSNGCCIERNNTHVRGHIWSNIPAVGWSHCGSRDEFTISFDIRDVATPS
jgi:hypothetical protein